MKQKNISTFLGEQCRKYRKILGITQEELAEKMNTTPQTISNYERMGIKDVDVENEISSILGVDLREETEENEGEPGELGKEILLFLMEHEGTCLVGDLLDKNILYGISKERLDNEVEKLAKKDMCYREEDFLRYKSDLEIYYVKDGYDSTHKPDDRLFITAKGIITTRNFITNHYQAERINSCSNIQSYEMVLSKKSRGDKIKKVGNAKDMEEYFELRPWHDMIKDISRNTYINYKADYISYLKNNWLPDFGISEKYYRYYSENEWSILFPGKSFYHDLLYRMAFGFSNDWRKENLYFRNSEELLSEEYEDAIQKYDEMYRKDVASSGLPSWVKDISRLEWLIRQEPFLFSPKEDVAFKNYMEETAVEQSEGAIVLDASNELYNNKILYKIFVKKCKHDNNVEISEEEIEQFVADPFFEPEKSKKMHESIFDEKRLKETLYKNIPYIEELIEHPMKWFTKEQIEKFIIENYKKPAYFEELLIQEKIFEIEKLIPEAKEEYYQFPKSWEENGLADLVREVCCLNM